jgi:hypothetical protein
MVDRNVRGSKRAFNVWRLAFGEGSALDVRRALGVQRARWNLEVGGRVSGLVVRLGFGGR